MTVRAVNPIEDTGFAEEYESFVRLANIHDAVSVEDFVNPEEETSECINWLDDAAIIAAAQTVEIDEEQETVLENVKELYADLSKKEEVIVLSKAIATVTKYSEEDKYDEMSETLIAQLRRLQRSLQWQERLERQERTQQTKLTQFFS